MKLCVFLPTLVCLLGVQYAQSTTLDELEQLLAERQSESELQSLRNIVGKLARQALRTQVHIEEKTRSEGDSGLKQIRHLREGTKTYYSDTVYGHSYSAIHDHGNNIRTIGMGEVTAVLNGVEFRTRHNDYSLKMPSATSNEYQAVDDIAFPDVPPAVLNKPTTEEQISEMREWFKAWRDQDTTIRDYKPYFKPVLCYMEGMWTFSDDSLEESFESDRHFLDANSWFELEEKSRFQAYTGCKGAGENLAYLPRVVFNVTEEGMPVFAQWNYDILCHPLENDVPLDRFRVVDDLSVRMRDKLGLGRLEAKKLARFQLNAVDEPFIHDSNARHSYLDTLMYQIPGKSGYNANFEDRGLENNLFKEVDDHSNPVNAARYHRNVFVNNPDAMGQQFRYRAYADENLYMAMTDQAKVAGMKITECSKFRRCMVIDQKWTYAIPLEIIYMTPLSNWNPYDILYRGSDILSADYALVTANGRNGQPGSPYDGTNSKNYYQTPNGFYDSTGGSEVDTDRADTTPAGAVAVLDSSGNERHVRATGHRIFLPEIEGLGVLRQRYPIAPIHAEGSMLWKEIEALKEIVMDPMSHGHLMYNPINAANFAGESSVTYTYRTSPANSLNQQHVHEFTITQGQFASLRALQNVTVTTNTANGHAHTFLIYALSGRIDRVKYHTCEGRSWCWDGHGRFMEEIVEGAPVN